jgi:hypothetical protein
MAKMDGPGHDWLISSDHKEATCSRCGAWAQNAVIRLTPNLPVGISARTGRLVYYPSTWRDYMEMSCEEAVLSGVHA